jgi:hypothetical protein
MALLAGLIGIGFGTLNADNQFWLPSLSPIFSSGTVLLGLGLLFAAIGRNITSPEFYLMGGRYWRPVPWAEHFCSGWPSYRPCGSLAWGPSLV